MLRENNDTFAGILNTTMCYIAHLTPWMGTKKQARDYSHLPLSTNTLNYFNKLHFTYFNSFTR